MEEVHEDKQSEEELGSIADDDQVPESEEEITQDDGPINPEEADEEVDEQ